MKSIKRGFFLALLPFIASPAFALQVVATPVADPLRMASAGWVVQLPAFQSRFGQPIQLEVQSSDTIDNVLQLLQDRTGLFPSDAEISFAGRLLARDRTLSDYNISNGADLTIFVATGAAVPEPGAWAMLVAGFGVIGFMLRRTRAAGQMAF